ncbi:HEAT repeat-containing protein 1-like [Tropilaelaps mercedesae]|uniref:HEAT repeat-containing protein 1 n=1 Tax=Tropilaelaps mercedesae TaxID=418985 RepID=A0A1V9X5H2_9ACAR|nr:HEAT repeat-containing protein 1-like [Tropilaelaps mercedesae]
MASGMTSLAAQLRKLRTPQTDLFDQASCGTSRASLLFDAKEAATLDRDTIFAIGCSGLEELCKLNQQAFARFDKTLFHDSSKDFQRAIQTREQNDQLDATLTEFLHRLSPYLLLRPAHKTLEWLIYRFRVHEHNTATLLQAILPFHETNIFARILQLIDCSDESTCWHFMAATKSHGAMLTKRALIAQCAKSPGLFRFVCELLPAMRKANQGALLRPAINLSTGVILGVMELHGHRIDARLVSAIVAHVADTFVQAKQDGNAEWVSANAMLVAQLAKKQPALKGDLLQLLLITMVKSLTEQSVNAGLYALLATYRYQTGLDTLPQKVVKGLLAFADLPARLRSAVGDSRHGDKFMTLFVHGLFVQALMEGSVSGKSDLVQPYLSFIAETAPQRQMVSEQFLKACLLVRVSSEDNKCLSAAGEILQQLKQRAGDELDAAIVSGLQTSDRELIAELVSECSLGIKHTPVGDTGETLFLALMSTMSHVRLAAVRAIVDRASAIDADEFVRRSLKNVIATETDPLVYDALMESLTPELLLRFVDADEAIGVITERLCTIRKKKWVQTNEKLVGLVCNGLAGAASERSVLRFLLTMSVAMKTSDVAIINQCLKSDIVKAHPDMKHLAKCEIANDAQMMDICDSVAAALAKGFSGASVGDCIQWALNDQKANLRTRYGSLRFVEHLVSQSKPLGVGLLNATLDTLQAMLPNLAEVDDELEALSGGALPMRCVTRVVSSLLKNMHPIKELERVPAWHSDLDARSSEITFLRRVFTIAVGRQRKANSFRGILNSLFTVSLPTTESRCNFLCDMLLGHLTGVQSDENLQLQAHSLCLLAQFIGDLVEGDSAELITLSIVIVLLSPSKRVRRLAVAVLQRYRHDALVDYLVKHANATVDVDTVLKCVATFHKGYKATLFNRMLASGSLTPTVRLGVARMLRNVATASSIDVCMELVQHYVDRPGLTINSVNAEIIELCLEKLSMGSARRLGETQQHALFGVLTSGNETLRKLGLRSLSSELFGKMADAELTTVIDHLLSSVLDAPSESHREAAESALKTLCHQQPKLVVAELAKVTVDDLASLQSVRDVKRLRTSVKGAASKDDAPAEDPLGTADWRRAVILLEVLHGVEKLSLQAVEEVVAALYDVLRRSLELPPSSTNAEYVKQCVLSCLQVHGTSSDELVRLHRHQIGLLVKALRLSQSAQTQHSVLAMLNHMARLYPDEVLQNMTSVFTFMGTSLLRQEDEYSFQVVVQTIQSVIPILLEASKSKSNKDVVSKVTRVFVDSWPDIPEHRRYPIFKKLIETLGPAEYAWTLVAQMTDHLLDKEADLEDCDFLDFMLGLVGDMSLNTILASCQRLLQFALAVPLSPKLANRSAVDKDIVNTSQCTDQRLADFKSVSAMFVEQVLSGTNFLSLAAELDDGNLAQAEKMYEALLAISLESIHALRAAVQDRDDDDVRESWKSCISLLHDCVDRINGILQPDTLVTVIHRLLAEELPSIRRNAMDMLNNKLIAETFFDGCDQIVTLVEPLCAQLHKADEQDIVSQQTALISLKLICRRIPAAKDELDKIFGIVDRLFRAHEKLPDLVLGGGLLLFAELCYSCPTKILSHFAKLMKRFLAISERADNSEAVILGLVVSYHRLVESLTGFLSPYLPRLIGHVCRLCADQKLHQKDAALKEQLVKICTHTGSSVPLRVLLPAVEDCVAERPLVKEHPLYLNHLLRILKTAIESSDRHVFDEQREVVQSLVLRLLHLREEADAELMDPERVTDAERFIVDCVTTLSLKMSEITFRPFIAKLYVWATLPETEDAGNVHRTATFYHLCYRLSDTLNGLFVLFVGQFIHHAVDTLDTYRAASQPDPLRVETSSWILAMLSNCFQYGGKSFITPELYKTVAKSIVDEIENTADCPASPYERRILTRVAPALANLALACMDADCKDLHNRVLFKTRSASASIRFAALQTFAAIVRRLGDDYVPLLPESVPFLAELMEDDRAEVEHLAQEVVQEMEQLLGEPLMKYF